MSTQQQTRHVNTATLTSSHVNTATLTSSHVSTATLTSSHVSTATLTSSHVSTAVNTSRQHSNAHVKSRHYRSDSTSARGKACKPRHCCVSCANVTRPVSEAARAKQGRTRVCPLPPPSKRTQQQQQQHSRYMWLIMMHSTTAMKSTEKDAEYQSISCSTYIPPCNT